MIPSSMHMRENHPYTTLMYTLPFRHSTNVHACVYVHVGNGSTKRDYIYVYNHIV